MAGSETVRGLAVIRLFVEVPLAAGVAVPLSAAQAHYLRAVMRRADGDAVAVFNGQDGEWRAEIAGLKKRGGAVVPVSRTRPQEAAADLWLLFAPVKAARLALIAEKATELGVSRLLPVTTTFTQGGRVNVDRLRANAVEAAEQCGRLTVPEVAAAQGLTAALVDWPADRVLWVADENGGAVAKDAVVSQKGRKSAVLVGPEGGFSPEELDFLKGRPFAVSISLGPRILRAETAVVAALTLVQALAGDWVT